MKSLSLFFFSCFVYSIAFAQLSGDFEIVSARIVPWSISVDTEKKHIEGFFGEVFIGAMKKAGLIQHFTPNFYPWKRAQEIAQKNKNTVIFPFIRTEARENIYKWVELLISSACYAWTISPDLKIETLDDIRNAGLIGGIVGAPQTTEVLQLLGPGYEKKVEGSKDEETAILKMMVGNIQVYSDVDYQAFYAVKTVQDNGQDPKGLLKNFRRGYKFYDAKIWIAISKETADEDVQKIQQAIADFKTTEEYKAMAAKYQIRA